MKVLLESVARNPVVISHHFPHCVALGACGDGVLQDGRRMTANGHGSNSRVFLPQRADGFRAREKFLLAPVVEACVTKPQLPQRMVPVHEHLAPLAAAPEDLNL